jgi:hypothetical protein
MIYFLLLFSTLLHADVPLDWTSAFSIEERHEFYKDNEVIQNPKNAWQVLFGVVYPDARLNLHKDCVFYRVPGEELGELKIKKISQAQSCEAALFNPGDVTWKEIKSLQFSTKDHTIQLQMTMPKYKAEAWNVKLVNLARHTLPHPELSSAEYKSPKMILLAPGTELSKFAPKFKLKEGDLCHKVSDDCEAIPSQCSDCPQGWYETPNGCMVGPKYCGSIECGKKNGPACRRGMKYQRSDKKLACRDGDISFAYCSPGLRIQCVGTEAWCR